MRVCTGTIALILLVVGLAGPSHAQDSMEKHAMMSKHESMAKHGSMSKHGPMSKSGSMKHDSMSKDSMSK